MGWLPEGAWTILRELTRHLLKRPVVGICAVARDAEGNILLRQARRSGQLGAPGRHPGVGRNPRGGAAAGSRGRDRRHGGWPGYGDGGVLAARTAIRAFTP